jgi:hypothetical protein
MKKLILMVALLTLVAFASGVMAAQQAAPAPAKPAGTVAPAPAAAPAPEKPAKAEKPAKPEKFSGTVEALNEAAKTVVVKGKKDEKTFVIDDKTKITKSGKEMPFADMKKGMTVSVGYKKDGDKMVAASIKASGPKAAKSGKKEMAEKPPEKPAEKPAVKPAEAPKK